MRSAAGHWCFAFLSWAAAMPSSRGMIPSMRRSLSPPADQQSLLPLSGRAAASWSPPPSATLCRAWTRCSSFEQELEACCRLDEACLGLFGHGAKRPWVGPTLPLDKICWRLALMLPHRGAAYPLFKPLDEILGGRQTARNRKLSLDWGILHTSAQVMRPFTVVFHCVQTRWLPWDMAFTWKRSCSSLMTSSTTVVFCCFFVALDQNCCGTLQPRPGLNPSPPDVADWRWHGLPQLVHSVLLWCLHSICCSLVIGRTCLSIL